MSLVVDSSMAVAWCLKDEGTGATASVLRDVVRHGAVAPSLWRLEVGNALQTALRRKRITVETRDEALADLRALDVAIDDETDQRAWSSTLRFADRYGLTLYDAAYLELAVRRRLSLASLDQGLRVAATKAGVELR